VHKKLLELLKKQNISTDLDSCIDLIGFIEFMLEYNKTHNLTAITDMNECLNKHIVDSLLPISIFKNKNKIIDIGCGAGFPSVPLSIINRNFNITAVDSVKKKTDFVKLVKNKFNLDNLNVVNGRIEDLAKNLDYREKFDIVISRAVAPLNVIIEYSAPFLVDGGCIVAYKGVNYEQEIIEAKNALKLLNCSIDCIKQYYINELDINRYVVLIKKNSKIDDKYPRGQNKPRLKPL